MPSTTVPGFFTLVDSRGNPYPSGPVGTQYRRTADDDRLRPAAPNHYGDYLDLLAPRNFQKLVSESRALGSRGQPFSLLDQKADYVAASDFRPRFTGQDTSYGTELLAVIEEGLKICNLRGPLFDWRTTLRLLIPTLATDGNVYPLLTRWPDTGWPCVQMLEAHRIGQRDAACQRVGADDALTAITDEAGEVVKTVRGAYKGCRIVAGHIYNTVGTEVAYRVLGSDPDGREDQDISARDLFRVARPRSYSEGRTPPELAAALFDFIGLELAQSAQLDQQIEDARLTLIETNDTGRYNPANSFGGGTGRGPGASENGAPTVESKRGRTRFVKTGYSVTAHESERPSDQWMNFDARVHSRGATGLGWRSEMLDPGALKAAANRALQDQINTKIRQSFLAANYAGTRILQYFASCYASPRLRAIPLHAETRRVSIAPPPWFEVDRASAKYDLDDVAAGRIAMSDLHERDGHTSREVYTRRARAYQEALAVQKEFSDVPLDFITGDGGSTVQRTGAGTPGATDPNATDAPEGDAAARLAEIEESKAISEAYGVAVRAGAITPSQDDETFMRKKLGLPALSAAAKAAWKKDEGSRRPITLTPPPGSEPTTPGRPAPAPAPGEE